MSPVRRDSTAGRAYLDLQAMARRTGRPTQELLVNYVLERFLFRLSLSPHRDRLILKGGMLLAVLGSRRPTADVDLLAMAIANDVDAIGQLIREVLAMTVDDGVTYEPDRLQAQVIRDAALYSGVRLSIPAHIDRTRASLRLDVNVGDPVTPHPVDIEYQGLLDESFHLLGYPLVTVLAEKIVTMIERGATTTRNVTSPTSWCCPGAIWLTRPICWRH
ncbi:MAG: nucleotidyl transferase AbiEii/AbiGii toxin family protein [Acidimicrobiales bacterium]